MHNWRKEKKSEEMVKDLNKHVSSIGFETPEGELKRLCKENDELKKVNYILKKAAPFFLRTISSKIRYGQVGLHRGRFGGFSMRRL